MKYLQVTAPATDIPNQNVGISTPIPNYLWDWWEIKIEVELLTKSMDKALAQGRAHDKRLRTWSVEDR